MSTSITQPHATCCARRTARPVWTLIASRFGLGMALLDVTAGIVAVPSIQESLHTDIRGLSWVIDGYTLSFASLLLLGGGLGDCLGAKQVFCGGLIAFTVAFAASGLSPNVPALIGAPDSLFEDHRYDDSHPSDRTHAVCRG
jgi:DHA2 family methylenomycin A resistance protein-like MFS transporter